MLQMNTREVRRGLYLPRQQLVLSKGIKMASQVWVGGEGREGQGRKSVDEGSKIVVRMEK